VFRNFFGGENPFDDLFPKKMGDEYGILPVMEPRTKKIQDEPVVETLLVSMEEAYLGCMKKMRLERREVLEPNGTSSKKTKILTINVKPGWKEGTKITFPKDGDQDPNRIPADIVFMVKYKPHPRFVRVGNDLIHTAKISLADALTGCIVELVMLDDRTLSIPVSDVVCPGYQLKVPGEGMPITKGGKGDLILKFDVAYPTSLSENQKTKVREGLTGV
jgi:DnaJ family protein B protein 13